VDVALDRIEDRRNGRSTKTPAMERRRDRSQLGAGVCKLDDQLMVIIDPRNMLKYVAEKVGDRT
jgi:hypothetical protein